MIARPVKMTRVERKCKARLWKARKEFFKVIGVPDCKANRDAMRNCLGIIRVDLEDLVFTDVWNTAYANRHYFYTEEQNAAD